MLSKLIALTVVLAAGIMLAASVGASGAQEAEALVATHVTTPIPTPTTTQPSVPAPVPPDMTLAEFREKRTFLRRQVNRIRWNKCMWPVDFRIQTNRIHPNRRISNLAMWLNKVHNTRDKNSKCFLVRGTPQQAIKLGRIMAAKKGWTGTQWSCLRDLFGYLESSWRWWADNPTSAAYGIPQALPGSKMTPNSNDWITHTWKQIRWGLGYVQGRYGTPCNAKAFRLSNGWY